MALTLSGFTLQLTLEGEAQARRTVSYELLADPGAVDDDAAFATAVADATAFINEFVLVSNARVISYRLISRYVEDTQVAVPADADLYTEASYTVGLDNVGDKKGLVTIPAPAAALFVNNDEATGELDPADGDLNALLTRYASPFWTRLSDGEQILSDPRVISARIRSVYSGKGF